MTAPDEDPIVLGGQGHEDELVERDGNIVGLAAVLIVVSTILILAVIGGYAVLREAGVV